MFGRFHLASYAATQHRTPHTDSYSIALSAAALLCPTREFMNDVADNRVASPSSPAHAELADGDLASTQRKVGFGFAFALACLGVVGVVSYWSVVRLNEEAAWVEHT